MSKVIKDLNSIYTTSDGLASCFNLTRSRIIALAKEGILIKNNDAKYNVQENVSAYVRHLKQGDKPSLDTETSQCSYWEEKAKHEKAKRELAEIEVKKSKNEVHVAGDVENVMANMLSTVRTKLLGLGSMMAPLLVGKSKEETSVIIAGVVDDILSELKDYDPGMFITNDENS